MDSRFLLLFILSLAQIDVQMANVQSRIVNGNIARIVDVPYVVGLLKRNGANYVFNCGGSLITYKHTLTAAHCVEGLDASSFIVHGASAFISKLGQNKTVIQMHIHPDYDTTTDNSDVAVLKTESFENTRYAKPYPICTRETLYKVGELALVSGWGLTSSQATEPVDRLRSVLVRVIGWRLCGNLYRGQVTNRMHCTLGPGSNDACNGDSGGGLVNLKTKAICGIVSWGRICGGENQPGVYVSVVAAPIKSFIERMLLL